MNKYTTEEIRGDSLLPIKSNWVLASEVGSIEEWLIKMIHGGEITTQFAKGNDFHESKGALEAFKAILDKLRNV